MNRTNKTLFFVVTMVLIGVMGVSTAAGEKPIAIRGGRFFTMTHGVIDGGTMIIRDGKIEAIGKEVTVPAEAEIIDAQGKVILPAFIDGFTNLGAADIASFGKDDDEATSPCTPHLRIIDGLNPDNRFIPVARKSGVGMVLCAPADGNLLTGQSALIRLSGSRVEEMTVVFPAAVHATLGEPPKLRYGKNNTMPMTRMGAAALLRQTFIDAVAYAEKIDAYEEQRREYEKSQNEEDKEPMPPKTDFKLQALVPVVRGELPLVVSADRYDDILTALRIAEEFNLKMILNHGAETYRVAEELASRNIPVIVGPLSYKRLKQETMKLSPKNIFLLSEAGVKIAFQTGSIENVSGLLAEARLAVANGLPSEEALKALTLYPAQMFGVDDRLGSLEVGKEAFIVIFDKDPIREFGRVERIID